MLNKNPHLETPCAADRWSGCVRFAAGATADSLSILLVLYSIAPLPWTSSPAALPSEQTLCIRGTTTAFYVPLSPPCALHVAIKQLTCPRWRPGWALPQAGRETKCPPSQLLGEHRIISGWRWPYACCWDLMLSSSLKQAWNWPRNRNYGGGGEATACVWGGSPGVRWARALPLVLVLTQRPRSWSPAHPQPCDFFPISQNIA